MADINISDFVNVLCLKNQLINVDDEVLLEVYKDYENYVTFLSSVITLINNEEDSPFLLYRDSFLKKINRI